MRTRFCPSPTGFIHLGNARTALFSYLLAQSQSGKFVLRIEDTDQERSEERYVQALMEDLNWLGWTWDEGPSYQSQRQAIYDQYYDQLIAQGQAYPCFCTEKRLEQMRKFQRSQGKPPRYDRRCAQLSAEEVKAKQEAGESYTLRFKNPDNEVLVFEDFVRGEHKFETSDLSDFIIRRVNGTAPFMYCNAIDDALMGVTHVLRGEDHLTNTPRQLLVLKALGLTAPAYGHMALIVGDDGRPLSKRNGSHSIQDLRQQGYHPLAVANYLARLGHTLGAEDADLYSLSALGEKFKIDRLSSSPSRYDEHQLNFWQRKAVQSMNDKELLVWLAEGGGTVQAQIFDELRTDFLTIVREVALLPRDALVWASVLQDEVLDLNETVIAEFKAVGAEWFEAALSAYLAQTSFDFKAWCQAITQATQTKGKALYHPLRLCLSGQQGGPMLGQLASLLSTEQITARLQFAAKVAQS